MVSVRKRTVDLVDLRDEVGWLRHRFRNITICLPGSTQHRRHKIREHSCLVKAWDPIPEKERMQK